MWTDDMPQTYSPEESALYSLACAFPLLASVSDQLEALAGESSPETRREIRRTLLPNLESFVNIVHRNPLGGGGGI